MKKQILLITVILGLMTLSCSKNDDQDSEYQGTWTGTFTGTQDNGTWTANIDSNGKITGTTSSTVFNASLQLNGSISSSGKFIATAGSASNGADFKGQMTETSGSGTWANNSLGIDGSWTGTKQ